MAMINLVFVDEEGQQLNQFRVLNMGTTETTVVQLYRDATITKEGTPLNATNLNLLVNSINELGKKRYLHNITIDDAFQTQGGDINFRLAFILLNEIETPITSLDGLYNAMPLDKDIVCYGFVEINNNEYTPFTFTKKSTGFTFNVDVDYDYSVTLSEMSSVRVTDSVL